MANDFRDEAKAKMDKMEMKAHEAKGRAEQKLKDIRKSHKK